MCKQPWKFWRPPLFSQMNKKAIFNANSSFHFNNNEKKILVLWNKNLSFCCNLKMLVYMLWFTYPSLNAFAKDLLKAPLRTFVSFLGQVARNQWKTTKANKTKNSNNKKKLWGGEILFWEKLCKGIKIFFFITFWEN